MDAQEAKGVVEVEGRSRSGGAVPLRGGCHPSTVLGAALPCSGHAELHWVEVGLVVVVEEVAHLLGHR